MTKHGNYRRNVFEPFLHTAPLHLDILPSTELPAQLLSLRHSAFHRSEYLSEV